MLSTWCERCYLLAVVLPLRDSLQGWVGGSSYCFIHLRSCLSLLIVLVLSYTVFSSLSRWLPASLEWWWVGLGSYPFEAYPSSGVTGFSRHSKVRFGIIALSVVLVNAGNPTLVQKNNNNNFGEERIFNETR